MKPVKMNIRAYQGMKYDAFVGKKHDPRINVFISKGKTTLKIAGYDMLPHLMDEKGDGYSRITWEQFREILTDPK